MPELIDKTAAYKALKHEAETHGLSFSAEAYDRAARIIDQMPTIEAEPVRHGRWVKSDVYTFKKCSECGAIWDAALCENIFFVYCPRCGSKNGGADNG